MDVASIGKGITGFVTAIIGLAILAVVLSNGANTVGVLNSFFSGLANLLKVVVAPVTGGSGTSLSSSAYPLGVTGYAGSIVPGNSASGGYGGFSLGANGNGVSVGTPYGGVNLSQQTIQSGISGISNLFAGSGGAGAAQLATEGAMAFG